MIALAAFLFAAPSFAQNETEGGHFYADCAPTDGPAVTMVLDSHVQIMVHGTVKPDDVYRTKGEVMAGERETMIVSQCDATMEICRAVEGVLTTYKVDGETIEGALEVLDGTEVQGDSESPQGKVHYFKLDRDKTRTASSCG